MNGENAPDSVTVTVLVAVDPAAAFEVFTDEVDLWWKRGPRFRFDREKSGVLRFEPGVGGRLVEVFDEATDDRFEVGRVLVWEPASRLVFRFRARSFEPGQSTEVEVRFEGCAEGTRVTVEHRGWSGLPPGHPARHGLTGTAFTGLIGLWWSDLLVEAKARAEKGTTRRQ